MRPLCGDKEPFRGQPGRGAQGQGSLCGEKLASQEPASMRAVAMRACNFWDPNAGGAWDSDSGIQGRRGRAWIPGSEGGAGPWGGRACRLAELGGLKER